MACPRFPIFLGTASDRYKHLVRYVGWYSNRARGARAKKIFTQAGAALPVAGDEPATEFAARAKAAWARLTPEWPVQ